MINQPQQVDPLTGAPVQQVSQAQPQRVDLLTGAPIQQGLPVQQQSQVPQVPSNELGSAKPLFSQKDQEVANGIFGDVQQKQNSVSPQFINPTY